ncbi:transporter substrate-binding domain-containing protein [Tissierella praeacuta]|uniref:Amino acid ABC transporter substrate-binding protein, PAAT family n=1 Tax=Tissierella praeacuta DSM 18095 TaxID=1123404 RepID=A0A1M4WVD1_9FIRM|nr:transporter substrate-binding domain-containing protein [Tissierella praeacuta]MBU5256600.1 transporter substrate-binding domain-containing protein [Tissierella praeacuta]TCU75787.1 amino acid ABC transporter substrate-binding protein (PAAT family) [Tissierella praeacuta]SHE85155.1 amino acid ABC transporter substrate-binding protein, PAAT family [Tissierella praeacuta DSM 18095]SUP00436.1 Arginine-binding extracellular protein ArtP precursor [Tissierella praeacuta]
MYKKIIISILIVSMMVAMVGCNKTAKKADSNSIDAGKLDEIKERGKIVLGTAADYPPYEFHKLINGKDEIVGFDIDIAKEIAADIGVELEIVDMKFEGLLPALVTDDIDFIVAGMVADEKRKKSVDFSVPYYQGKQRIIVRNEDKDKLKEPEDFNGLKVGAQKSTIQEEIAAEKFSNAEYVGLSKITDLVLELKNKKIDGLILVEPVAIAYVAQNKDLYMPEVMLGQEDGVSVAVNKDSQDLLKSINETLDRLINNGSIDKFIQDASALADEN